MNKIDELIDNMREPHYSEYHDYEIKQIMIEYAEHYALKYRDELLSKLFNSTDDFMTVINSIELPHHD